MGARDQVVRRLYVSPEEFADATGLRKEHVWRLLREGRLPYQKFGRWYRIPLTALGEAAALLEQAGDGEAR